MDADSPRVPDRGGHVAFDAADELGDLPRRAGAALRELADLIGDHPPSGK
jgi:hypothetical protein